jgi:DNA-3-methyladenine glycosylase II
MLRLRLPALPLAESRRMSPATRAADVAAAEVELSRRDPVLADLIVKAGPCTLRTRRRIGANGHFEDLARSIVYQQLAGKAAAAIWGRVRLLVDGDFAPEAVLALDEPTLRGAGLSNAKARSVRDLAERVAAGDVHLSRVARLTDDEIVAELSRVRGIGRWTAEMFLMFRLGRPDVLPVDDYGIRRGFMVAFGRSAPPSRQELADHGERWRPYRTVASWYLWRAAETKTPLGPR